MNYDKELAFAKELALVCGEIMAEAFKGGLTRDWKEDGTPLTYADTKINSYVIAEIEKIFPDDGVLGEEESTGLDAARIWVCDPVDGTMPFSHGLAISTFSLALTIAGKSVLGVVYDPFTQRLFSAQVGGGAYLNEEVIHVSSQADLSNSLIDLEGFPMSSHPIIQTQDGFVKALNELGAHTTALWSVILPAALIAAGQFSAVIFNVNKPEDGAAIKVIVEEAGGKVTDLFGNEQRNDGPTQGFIASNGLVHEEIVRLIQTHTI